MHEKASLITVMQKRSTIIFDFAPLQGRTIEADLRQRDFTCNAIASPLSEAVWRALFSVPRTEVGPLMRKHDRSAVPRNVSQAWLQSLNATLEPMRRSRHPMLITWAQTGE